MADTAGCRYVWNKSLAHGDTDGVVLCEKPKATLSPKSKCQISCDDLWPGYYLCVGI